MEISQIQFRPSSSKMISCLPCRISVRGQCFTVVVLIRLVLGDHQSGKHGRGMESYVGKISNDKESGWGRLTPNPNSYKQIVKCRKNTKRPLCILPACYARRTMGKKCYQLFAFSVLYKAKFFVVVCVRPLRLRESSNSVSTCNVVTSNRATVIFYWYEIQ